MKASFTKAIRYHIDIACTSPLRTGSEGNDTQVILRSWDGTPILQGTSLAGALRAYAETIHLDTDRLFGSQRQEGELTVSELRFEAAVPETRPRLRIDRKTGTAASGGKFDIAALPAGTKGSFELVWKSCRPIAEGQKETELLLAALDSGEIRLGAQRANGFGRVRAAVYRRTFDLMDSKQRRNWLDDEPASFRIELPSAAAGSRYVHFRVSGKTAGLLVKDGVGRGYGENGIDAVNITGNDRPVVPASSIKGAVRARVQEIGEALQLPQAADDIFGCPDTGEAGKAGSVLVSDGSFSAVSTEKITRIRIDRFTGGVIRGGLFTEEPVSGILSWEISIPAEDSRACALVLFALRDLGLGAYSLGSGAGIGRGRLTGLTVTAEKGSRSLTLRCRDGAAELEDPSSLADTWLNALGGEQA